MKVYVDELPKSCQKCPFCEYFEEDAHGKGKHEVACYFNGSLGNILCGNQTNPKTCQLKTLVDHDKKVRAKEELLSLLIGQIDLIMHGKQYRFENKDGTWYSRESCCDLTLDELSQELLKELLQLNNLVEEVEE